MLWAEAKIFAQVESNYDEIELFGVTDGKAIGTYFELKFRRYLLEKYSFAEGNAARGIDFPELRIDMKVTSQKQPQSSSPYTSASQKIYGLGYSLLIFVYAKTDNPKTKTGRLSVVHAIFVDSSKTADYQTTSRIRAYP